MPIDKAKFFNSNFKGYTEFFSYCYDKKKMKICFYTMKTFQYVQLQLM